MDEHLRNKVLVFMLMSLCSLEEGERKSLCRTFWWQCRIAGEEEPPLVYRWAASNEHLTKLFMRQQQL